MEQFLTDKEVREKLVSRGAESLSDTELLSILIQDGSASGCTSELASRVLNSAGGTLSTLSRIDMRKLRITEGLGIKKAAILTAAFELGRRIECEKFASPIMIKNNEDIEKMFRPKMSNLRHEEFWVVYLSTANTVLGQTKISQGGSSSTTVDHKIIVKKAVELLSSGIILVHNHPSGVAKPSKDDKVLTDKVAAAAALFDISILDHLIITSGECFSFRGAGLV